MVQDYLKGTLQNIIEARGFSDVEVQLERPKDENHGDFSTNIAMILAGKLRKQGESVTPLDLAHEIVASLQIDIDTSLIKEISVAAPGFINFSVAPSYYFSLLQEVLDSGADFGKTDTLDKTKILIEHTSPNPTKGYHLGHLRNTVTGISMANLFSANGAEVVQDCIDNNRGIAIARLMWGYLKFGRKSDTTPVDIAYWFDHPNDWITPEEKGVNAAQFMGEFYRLGTADFKEDAEVEKVVRDMVIAWEADDELQWKLWRKTQEWVWEGMRESLERINGWVFDKVWHEHELYKEGKEHVQRGVREGVFRQLDDGAVLTDFEKTFGIPDTILQKRDGTSLYITQDLELTHLKRKTFDPERMFWVIGPEQSLAMQQMFAAASQLGFGNFEDFTHLAYGFILLRDEEGKVRKLSSRGGKQFYVDDLIDEAKQKIMSYITSDLSDTEREYVAEQTAIGALKYSLLRVTRTQDMVFDLEETISFEGDSGPYLLYTNARILSVTQQAGDLSVSAADAIQALASDEEVRLAKLIQEFPPVVQSAAEDFAPHYVCNYLFSLAQAYNSFYHHAPILKADTEQQKAGRILLSQSVSYVLQNGLSLLGITWLERM